MKIKLTAVLLCVAILLTLSFNVLANGYNVQTQALPKTQQNTSVINEVTVNVGENGVNLVETPIGTDTSTRAQTSGIISGGIYRIKNVASGKYMNVCNAIDADGTNIYQWSYEDIVNQRFKVVYSSSTDSYLLHAMCSSNGTNRVADVYDHGGNIVEGSNIKLETPDEPPSQQLQIISVGSGKYRIAMKKANNFVFTAYGTSNGSSAGTTSTSAGNIFISAYTGATNQQWEFEIIENPNGSQTPVGYLDRVTYSTISGWAYQSSIPNTPLNVHIYIINNSTGEQKVIMAPANIYRADLEAAGYGNGYHGYSYSIDWRKYKPGTYTVRVYALAANGSNPQLTGSPKTYTVRKSTGCVDSVSSSGIRGWAWKPDAPNSAIDVHVYIYDSSGAQVEFYVATANQPRPDLAELGYGNGAHGFSKSINWASLPEERLRVVAYAVDGSDYNPSFYEGYYDNRMPMHVIGMVDDAGVDFSTWATDEVIGYMYDIGTPNVIVHNEATDVQMLEYIRDSSFAVISTHGSATNVEWCINPKTPDEERKLLTWYEVMSLDPNYFSNTRCLLLNACEVGNETQNYAGNNMVKAFEEKGIQTVVGFINSVYFSATNGIVDNTFGSERWAKVFVLELGNGKTVENAKNAAVDDAVDYFRDPEELDEEKQYDDAFAEAKSCGLVDVAIEGNAEQIVKH